MSYSAFIEPIDVWSFRGNRLFGAAGSWGQAVMPPPPSVWAGALRSALLTHDRVDLQAFADNQVRHPEIGTREEPGSWQLQDAVPALRTQDGRIEPLFPRPADVVPLKSDEDPNITKHVGHMRPSPLWPSLAAAQPLPLVPVLAEGQRSKPASHRWLTAAGMQRWLDGQTVLPQHVLADGQLWSFDDRVGVALDETTRRSADGRLFSVQTVACRQDVGMAVRVQGAPLPRTVLRLGGDGRGAHMLPQTVDWPEPDCDAIARSGRARLCLSAPGLFPRGWLPVGCEQPKAGEGARFELGGVRARVVAAAVPRAQVVSGFDLARRSPKAAQRAVPAGAVYWLDDLQTTAEALAKLVNEGLWPRRHEDEGFDAQRRAEGYNRCLVAAWRD